ncbi:hypothetical protein FBUS_02897, partial [Fasciolopsis buskii]
CLIALFVFTCLQFGKADQCQSDVAKVISQCRFKERQYGTNWKRCAIEKFGENRFKYCSRAQNYMRVFKQSERQGGMVESVASSS